MSNTQWLASVWHSLKDEEVYQILVYWMWSPPSSANIYLSLIAPSATHRQSNCDWRRPSYLTQAIGATTLPTAVTPNIMGITSKCHSTLLCQRINSMDKIFVESIFTVSTDIELMISSDLNERKYIQQESTTQMEGCNGFKYLSSPVLSPLCPYSLHVIESFSQSKCSIIKVSTESITLLQLPATRQSRMFSFINLLVKRM